MSEINLKLKTYDELTFEISRLNIDKYLLEQKLQQKENIIKEVREYIEKVETFALIDKKIIFSISTLKAILDKEKKQ